MRTEFGRFGIYRQTVSHAGVVIHECRSTPELERRRRSFADEFLVRGLSGPVHPWEVVKAGRPRRDTGYIALGLLVHMSVAGYAVFASTAVGDDQVLTLDRATELLLGTSHDAAEAVAMSLTEIGKSAAELVLQREKQLIT